LHFRGIKLGMIIPGSDWLLLANYRSLVVESAFMCRIKYFFKKTWLGRCQVLRIFSNILLLFLCNFFFPTILAFSFRINLCQICYTTMVIISSSTWSYLNPERTFLSKTGRRPFLTFQIFLFYESIHHETFSGGR
jgi:hypothetical protein